MFWWPLYCCFAFYEASDGIGAFVVGLSHTSSLFSVSNIFAVDGFYIQVENGRPVFFFTFKAFREI